MKRLIKAGTSFWLSCLLVLSPVLPFMMPSALAAAPSTLTGTGLSYDPYVIGDCAAWVYIADNPEDYFDPADVNYFVLKSDLDCTANGNDVMWGTLANPVYANFNGNSFTITIDLDVEDDFSGLFTQVLRSDIQRLHVHGTIDSAEEISYVGGVAGLVNSSVISEVRSTVDINTPSADIVGGIVGLIAGETQEAYIENSYVDVDINGAEYVGGIVGQMYNAGNAATVTTSYSLGSIAGDRYVGGITGEVNGEQYMNYNFSAAEVVLGDPYQDIEELNLYYAFEDPSLTDSKGNGGDGAVTGDAVNLTANGDNPAYPLVASSGTATQINFDVSGVFEAGDMQLSFPILPASFPGVAESATIIAFYDDLDAEVVAVTLDEFGDLQLTSDNGTDTVLLGDPVDLGELSMVTLRYTAGTDTWEMYINDTLVDSDTFGAGTTDYTDIEDMTVLLGSDAGFLNGGIGRIALFDSLQDAEYNTFVYNGGNIMPYEFEFVGGIMGNVTDTTVFFPNFNFYDSVNSGLGENYCAALIDSDQLGDIGIAHIDFYGFCSSVDTGVTADYFFDEANEPFTIDFGDGDVEIWNLLIQEYSNGAWYFAGDDYPELNAYRELGAFSGDGSGTEADPYVIDDCALFEEIGYSAETLAAYYELGSDLDCTATGNDVMVPHTVGPFTGVFDGADFTVTVDIEDDQSLWDIGLFRETNFAHIHDMNVAGEITESVAENTGGLIGFALNTKVESSSSSVTLSSATDDDVDDTAYDAGVLIGDIESGYLSDVFANGSIDLPYTNFVGGLVGELENTPTTNAYATGDVTGDSLVGGLIGNIEDGTLSIVYATGDVFGVDENIGGLAGDIDDSDISECYATGSVDSDGSDYTGGLFGLGDDNLVDECYYSTGTVDGYDYTGGIFGEGSDNTITNTYSSGNINGEGYVGGIIGDSNGDNILEFVYTTGNITGNGEDVGGLIGDSDADDEIYRSYSTSNVSSPDEDNVGGLVGRAEDVTVDQSYFYGTVEGDSNVGGFFGIAEDTYIYDSYARGTVTANDDDAGGLIGESYGDEEIYDSYSTAEVLSDSEDYGGGILGYDDGSPSFEFTFWDLETSGVDISDGNGEEGKTTEEMKTLATYTTDLGGDAWDFDEIWAMDAAGVSNDGYPFLQWQDLSATSNRSSSSSGSYVKTSNSQTDGDSDYQAEIERATEKEIVTKEFTKEADKCEALMMMSRVFEWDLDSELEQHPFSDVPEWCEQLANYAYTNGVVQGRSETILGLDTPMNRYEAVVMIYRELVRQNYVYLGSSQLEFEDPIMEWAVEAVEKLVAEEIIKGFADGTFGGDQSIIKQDLAVILLRTLESL